MRKRATAAFAAFALAGGIGETAAAAGTYDVWNHPIVKELKESTHHCGGAYDAACRDESGAFCTLWLGHCTVGE